MCEILTESAMDELLDLATDYADSKNLLPDHYLAGMLEPLMQDADRLDLELMVRTLIRYHADWLHKNR